MPVLNVPFCHTCVSIIARCARCLVFSQWNGFFASWISPLQLAKLTSTQYPGISKASGTSRYFFSFRQATTYMSKYEAFPTNKLKIHIGSRKPVAKPPKNAGTSKLPSIKSHNAGLTMGMKTLAPKVSWNLRNCFAPKSLNSFKG